LRARKYRQGFVDADRRGHPNPSTGRTDWALPAASDGGIRGVGAIVEANEGARTQDDVFEP